MKMSFGEEIRISRESMGLTQDDAATAIRQKYGVRLSSAYLSMIERGERTNLTLNVENAIREYFNLTYTREIDLQEALEDNSTLIKAGDILLTPQQRYAIASILVDNNLFKINQVPLLGNIRAGIPLLSEQNIIGHIDIPADMVGKVDFALNVQGDSMIGAGINTGDVAVCKEDHEAVTGQIVVALVNNDETTLKYYFREDGQALLRAANPDYKDIELKPGDIIQGHVVKILKDSPPVNTYREYIYFKEGHLQEWNKVVEKAVASGIKPSLIGEFLESQMEIAKRLAGK